MPLGACRERRVFRATRRVLAALSKGIRSERALMRTTKLKRTALYAAIRRLGAAGYIERPEFGAIVVHVPFIITGGKAK